MIIELPEDFLEQIVEEVVRRTPSEQKSDAVNKVWLSAREAAQYLSLSRSQFYRLVRLGDIPAYQPTEGKLLFNRAELDDWVKRSRRETK